MGSEMCIRDRTISVELSVGHALVKTKREDNRRNKRIREHGMEFARFMIIDCIVNVHVVAIVIILKFFIVLHIRFTYTYTYLSVKHE